MSTHRFSQLGFALMAGGFLWGAYLIVSRLDYVDWYFYAPAFLLTALGSFMLRFSRGRAGAEADKVAADISIVDTSLKNLLDKVSAMNADVASADVYGFSKRIDDECMDPINDFVEAREALIHRYGLSEYAAVMDRFALGERSLNRAWCASADGYIDEVTDCLARAEAHFEAAHAVVDRNLRP